MQEMLEIEFQTLGQKDPLGEEMATCFLTWKIPWTERAGGLQSMGSQRVRHHWISTRTQVINPQIEAKSHQFSSVSQSCPTLCDPMNRSTPGLPVHHQLPEFTQTDVHWVGDAIQPSHPLSSPSSPTLNLSQHQGLFQWVSSSHQLQLQQQSFQWTPKTDLL